MISAVCTFKEPAASSVFHILNVNLDISCLLPVQLKDTNVKIKVWKKLKLTNEKYHNLNEKPEGQNTPRLTYKVTINLYMSLSLKLQSFGRRRTTSVTGLRNTFGEP